MIKRIGLTGVPGSGKTSTARALSALCRKDERFKKVELISEYARRYITKYGSIQGLSDQYLILDKQLGWENTPAETDVELIITDCPIHLGWLYVMEFQAKTAKDVMYTNDIFKKMNKANFPQRYDIIFHLPPALTPVEDGVRHPLHFDEEWRKEADFRMQFVFRLFPPKKFITIKSLSLLDRVSECLGHIMELPITEGS